MATELAIKLGRRDRLAHITRVGQLTTLCGGEATGEPPASYWCCLTCFAHAGELIADGQATMPRA